MEIESRQPNLQQKQDDVIKHKRSARACEACRQGKSKCIGAFDPPCARCKSQGTRCFFPPPVKRKKREAHESNPQRLRNVEQKLDHYLESLDPEDYNLGHISLPPNQPGRNQHMLEQPNPTSLLGDFSNNFASPPPSLKDHRLNYNLSPVRLKEPPMATLDAAYAMSSFGFLSQPTPSGRTSTPSPSISRPTEPAPAEPNDLLFQSEELLKTIEEEERRLFQLFMSSCETYAPIFDLDSDSFTSTKQRSLFLFQAILAIASEFVPSPSCTGRNYRREAEALGSQCLFSATITKEAVQGFSLLGSWSLESSFCLTGVAIRLARDLRMDKALALLETAANAKDQSTRSIVNERELCNHARIWLYLCWLDYQISLGKGRSLPTYDVAASKSQCDILLRHRFSRASDVKLVCNKKLLGIECRMMEQFNLSGPLNDVRTAWANNMLDELVEWAAEAQRNCLEYAASDHQNWIQRQLYSAKIVLLSRVLSSERTTSSEVIPQVQEFIKLARESCQGALQHCFVGMLGQDFYKSAFASQSFFVETAFSGLFVLHALKSCPLDDSENLHTTLSIVDQLSRSLFACKYAHPYALTLRIALDRTRRSLDLPTTRQHTPTQEAELDRVLSAPMFSTQKVQYGSDENDPLKHQVNSTQLGQLPAWIRSNTVFEPEGIGSGFQDLFLPSWTQNFEEVAWMDNLPDLP